MVRYFEVNGQQCPADYSIVMVARLAKRCGTDITGLVEMVQGLSDEGDFLEFAAKVGTEALNFGAKREATGMVFSEFDLYDAFTADVAIAGEMVTALVETLTDKEVFSEPTATSAKTEGKRKKKNAE